MTTDIKELARQLRLAREPIRHTAALALEVLAGEVERLTSDVDALGDNLEKAIAERDGLKAALEAFVKHFGPLQDNAMLHENVRNCYRIARKALGDAAGDGR